MAILCWVVGVLMCLVFTLLIVPTVHWQSKQEAYEFLKGMDIGGISLKPSRRPRNYWEWLKDAYAPTVEKMDK